VFPAGRNDRKLEGTPGSGPKGFTTPPPDDSAQEQRRQLHRKLLLVVHAIAAFWTAALYLSNVDLVRFDYWRRGAAIRSILVAFPALLPYIVSAIHSWRTATNSRPRVVAFLAILMAGAFGVICAIVGAFGLSVNGTDLFWIFVIQAAVYFFSAEFLFDVD
jgi:hypothetical protein